MRMLGWGVVALAVLAAGCTAPAHPWASRHQSILGQAGKATAPGTAGGGAPAIAAASARLTPEQAEEKARKQAAGWRADAALVGVVWAVPKLELSSAVFHVFRGGKADELCVVETKLTSFWQKRRVVADRKLAVGALALAEIERWPVDARRALAIAKAELPAGQDRPLALLALGRARLAPPLWGVTADEAKVLIHAETGKVLAGVGTKPVELLGQAVAAATKAD